jgi:predicted secreted protein
MKKKTFTLTTAINSTSTLTFENTNAAEKILIEKSFPTPPSEETIARLNAIGREYPFCAYMKQNKLYLL